LVYYNHIMKLMVSVIVLTPIILVLALKILLCRCASLFLLRAIAAASMLSIGKSNLCILEYL